MVFEKVGWVLSAEELGVQSRWWRGLGELGRLGGGYVVMVGMSLGSWDWWC